MVGAGVGGAVAIGPARLWLPKRADASVRNEFSRRNSFASVQVAIQQLAENLQSSNASDVMVALIAILKDPKLADEIRSRMSDGADATSAIRGGFARFATQLEKLGGYFAERSADLIDLAERLIQELTAGTTADPNLTAGPNSAADPSAATAGIIVAQRLSPIDVSKFTPDKVLGFITVEGGVTSHTAVVARAQNLPAVLSVVGAESIREDDLLLLDSSSGQVFVNPNAELLNTYRAARRVIRDEKPALGSSIVPVYANIGSSTEGRSAKEYGADGVGLYRSELVFLGQAEPPTMQEQVFEYSRLLARFAGLRVIVRLLDLDTDKPLPFLKPAQDGRYTGRGLSTLLLNREVLQSQLNALKRAHDYYPAADLWVMAPMVTSVDQAREFTEMARAAGLPKVGAMVEVPEVTGAEQLAEILPMVDFISVGTNDLTRYTLDLDREHSMRVADTKHPDVISQVESVIMQAKRAGVPVGVCGEAAADPELARLFIRFGVDSLSASPALIPALRRAID